MATAFVFFVGDEKIRTDTIPLITYTDYGILLKMSKDLVPERASLNIDFV